MTPGDALESALQVRWSFDELEVYADYLLAKQDVRGELVALDLIPRPDEQRWVQRRHAALAKWIGPDLAAQAGHLVQHGFVHDLRDGMAPRALLSSEAGTYLRGSTPWGRTRVRTSLERLAAEPRPWLSRLTIAYHGRERLPDALVARLIAATPRLTELTLCGRPPFAAFPHPALQRVRTDLRCAAIEVPASKTLVEVPDGCAGPPVSDDDLELVMQLVELAPDCNQLYTHGEQFTEPLPALIARLAAAGLVELHGPVVHVASPGMVLAPRTRARSLPELVAVRGWIDGDSRFIIPDLRAHAVLIATCVATLPVSPRLHDTLVEYHQVWERAQNGRGIMVSPSCAKYRAALNALLELRGLWRVELGTAEDWMLVEELVTSLPDEGAHFCTDFYYDWY